MIGIRHLGIIAALLVLINLTPLANAYARDAAFINPGAANMGAGDEAIKVDPKAEIDIGETPINVAKHTSVFFVNQTNIAVKIEKVVVNGDSNVTAEISANDCSKQGAIAPQSRCSVEVSATPTGTGAWTLDLQMTHDGAGRIARAHITGKTSGGGSADKSTGLSVSSKETKPVDFGSVDIGTGKNVRSTLMVNDSPEPITIYSIDVIEADNGLQRLDQGCAVDMELAPGASCPVTLLWVPQANGPISTDLIIRHSGKLGFAVIPVRGTAKGGENVASGKPSEGREGKDVVPLPPSAKDLEKEMAGRVTPLTDIALGDHMPGGRSGSDGGAHLIGTIGDRALFLKPDGTTEVVSTGGVVAFGERIAKLIAVGPRSADVTIEGKKKTYLLEAVSSLVNKASEQSKQDADAQKSGSGPGGSKK